MNKNIFKNLTIENLICRLNVCAPEWQETDCSYGFYKFYYFLEGEGTIIIQGDKYHPQPGELFLIPATTRHTYFHNTQKPVYKYWCHFNMSLSQGQNFVYSKDAIKCQLPMDTVIPIFKRFVNLDTSNNPLDKLTEKASLLELLKVFLEHVNSESILTARTDDFVDKINTYIRQNMNKEISLAQLAEVVHLHPNYFIQIFKKYFSVTPIEYVNSVRLHRATQLLTSEKDKSVSTVAYEVGFNDYRYFARLFKRKYGITPSFYNKK